MKVIINGHEVIGHPKDISYLLRSNDKTNRPKPRRSYNGFQRSVQNTPNVELQNVVDQSQQLRQQLAQNPEYNPYPGVLPGEAENLPPNPQPRRQYAAEQDTGVKYE